MPKKAGRPRLTGVIREPNGKPSRAARLTSIQRDLVAIRATYRDGKWGTPLGLLCLEGKITERQFEAGEWFAEARKAADAAFSLPPRNPAAQDMNRLHGASQGEDTPEQIARKRRIVETYAKAEAVLGEGTRRLKAVLWVCVFERRHDDHSMLLDLLEGLSLLAHYRNVRRAA